MPRPNARRLAIALLAGAAGVALNLVPLPAVARLWPGRVVTLPIAILYGPWYGLLSALIAAAPFRAAVVLPVVFSLEALIVGAFARRGKPTLVAGAPLWVATAGSLGVVARAGGLGSPRASVCPRAL